ncbi:MAG: tyrosine-type recombinase/integrase [Bacteroidetes bacterium]|nr:tyrosine-type recombinase/integrase [Bacteroidota bacterium]
MAEVEFKELQRTFEEHLARVGKHQNTIRSYANDLRQFAQWCGSTFGETFLVGDVTRSDIQDFRTFLLTRNSSPASVNRKITALRQFFDFCVLQEATERNPASDISGIAAEPRAPVVLTRKDALLLARTAERSPGPIEGAVILLLLHSGLRSSELCAITVGDVHMTPREARLFVKGVRGKTTRFVYLSSRAQNALRQYMRWRGVSILAKRLRKESLFVSYDGTPLTQQAVDQLVKRVGRQAGLNDITPSMLRNTYASAALQSGKPVETVARVLGVSSLKTLQRLKGDTGEERES